jgi:hypothetical protein
MGGRINSEQHVMTMWSQSIGGLFMTIGRKMVLTIPLPTIARLVSARIVNGELVVVFKALHVP